jgi:hypothetical protein
MLNNSEEEKKKVSTKIQNLNLSEIKLISFDDISLQMKRRSNSGLLNKLKKGNVPVISYIEGPSIYYFAFYNEYIDYLRSYSVVKTVKPKVSRQKQLPSTTSASNDRWALCSANRAYKFPAQLNSEISQERMLPFYILVCNYIAFSRLLNDPNVTAAGERAIANLKLKERSQLGLQALFFGSFMFPADKKPPLSKTQLLSRLDASYSKYIQLNPNKASFAFLLPEEKETFVKNVGLYFKIEIKD